jgi:hypothetical protein
MDLKAKRAAVLASMAFPVKEDLGVQGAGISIEDPGLVDLQEAPFFGGYMEDMLEDFGVSHNEEEQQRTREKLQK